jgi:hypothetical protein
MVWIDTPAASAISTWVMQPATRSVAVLKSMAVDVKVDKTQLVYYNIDSRERSKAAGIPAKR